MELTGAELERVEAFAKKVGLDEEQTRELIQIAADIAERANEEGYGGALRCP
jgi:hypothetical protein